MLNKMIEMCMKRHIGLYTDIIFILSTSQFLLYQCLVIYTDKCIVIFSVYQ